VATHVTDFGLDDPDEAVPAAAFKIRYTIAYPLPTANRPLLPKKFDGTYTLNVTLPQ
jgi:hypothetical protein